MKKRSEQELQEELLSHPPQQLASKGLKLYIHPASQGVSMPKARKHQISLAATPYTIVYAAAYDAPFCAALTPQLARALNTCASGWRTGFYT